MADAKDIWTSSEDESTEDDIQFEDNGEQQVQPPIVNIKEDSSEKANKYKFRRPILKYTEGNNYNQEYMPSCDLLIVAGSVSVSSFLHTYFNIDKNTEIIGKITFYIPKKKDEYYITIYAIKTVSYK